MILQRVVQKIVNHSEHQEGTGKPVQIAALRRIVSNQSVPQRILEGGRINGQRHITIEKKTKPAQNDVRKNILLNRNLIRADCIINKAAHDDIKPAGQVKQRFQYLDIKYYMNRDGVVQRKYHA